MKKNTICLWYNRDAEAAAQFYAQTFPGSVVGLFPTHTLGRCPPPTCSKMNYITNKSESKRI